MDGGQLPEAQKGLVWLPQCGVVERRLAWSARLRRWARDLERTPDVFRELPFIAFAILMLQSFIKTSAQIL